jgi:serine phosphatase RsbU (regulator of sigma subunit)
VGGGGDAIVRLDSLQAVAVDLAEALSPGDVAAVIVRRATHAFGGLSGSLCVILDDGETFELVEEIGYGKEIDQRWSTFPVAAPLPAGDAVRSRRPVVMRSVAERDERYPIFRGVATASGSFVVLPLLIGDRALGVFTIGFPQPRDFTDDDLGYLGALASLCGQALHRAQLVERAENSARRLELLAEASDVLNASLDYDVTLRALSKLIVPRLADGCIVVVTGDAGPQAMVADHVDTHVRDRLHALLRAHPAGLSERIGIGAVLQTGRPEYYPTFNAGELEQVTDGAQREALDSLRVGAAAVIPLTVAGRTFGCIALSNLPGRPMPPDDFTLAQEVAARAASAVENARLYRLQSGTARMLQEALLPPLLPAIDGLQLAARYVPTGEGMQVGGDFYDATRLDATHWLLAIGDVCGNGSAAARHTALVRHAIRSAAVTTQSPAHVLQQVNHTVLRYHADTGPDDDTSLCTVCVAVMDTSGDTVRATVAAAGHPLPLLLTPGGQAVPVGEPGQLIGVFDDIDIHEREVELEAGSALVFYTDGITDRHRAGHFFGEDGLAAALSGADGSPAEIADLVVRSACGFTPGEPADDMAVLVAKAPATTSPA